MPVAMAPAACSDKRDLKPYGIRAGRGPGFFYYIKIRLLGGGGCERAAFLPIYILTGGMYMKMDTIALQASAAKSGEPKQKEKNISGNAILRSMLERLGDAGLSEMTEDEKRLYEQRIIQKMREGRRLSAKELSYLRLHNPELYKVAIRVELSRKMLRNSLKKCRSKDEVRNVVMNQFSALRSMKDGDPAKEYMAAMIRKELSDFRKSREYAQLPEKTEHNAKERKLTFRDDADGDEEAQACDRAVFFTILRLQCEELSQMTEAALAFQG